jgi:hypothetical protein
MQMIDYWYRDLFPIIPFERNNFLKTHYHEFANIENWLCWNTIFGQFASNIEFVANKAGE